MLKVDYQSRANSREVCRAWNEAIQVKRNLWLKVIKGYTECSDELLKEILEKCRSQILLVSILDKIFSNFPKGTKQRHRFLKTWGKTPIHIAAGNGHVAIYWLIMENVVDKNPMGLNLQPMIYKGHKPNQLHLPSESAAYIPEYTPLHLAALNGHFSICKLIIENVVEMNPQNNALFTPLHVAAASSNDSIFEIIIESIRGNKNPRDRYGNTPVHIAAGHGHFRICFLVLSYIEVVNNFDVTHQETPYHLAAANGHIEVYKYMMARKLPGRNLTNSRRQFPIHHAATYGYLDMCKLILESAPNKDVCRHKDVFGNSPLMMANQNNHSKIRKYFLAETAPRNMKRSRTPFHEKQTPTEESSTSKKKK